jgi:ADP-heptose:LPS heptosyltransferase
MNSSLFQTGPLHWATWWPVWCLAHYQTEQWPAPEKTSLALPHKPYVVLHVGASTVHKQWLPERWLLLAERLTQAGYEIVWSAGPNERNYVNILDPERRYHHQYIGIGFGSLWHLLQSANFLISLDTSIAHFGRIVGVPTVTLFGPGSAVIVGPGDFWRLSAYRAVTIADFPCRDQRQLFKRDVAWMRHCARSLRECPSNRCMQALDVDMVLSATATLTQTRSRAGQPSN